MRTKDSQGHLPHNEIALLTLKENNIPVDPFHFNHFNEQIHVVSIVCSVHNFFFIGISITTSDFLIQELFNFEIVEIRTYIQSFDE